MAKKRVMSWPTVDDRPQFRPLATRLAEIGGESPERPSWGAGVPNGAMLVAEGRVDAFVFFAGQIWDHAAPAAVVRAAGGGFSGLDGTDALTTGGGIYTNGHIHDQLLDHLLSLGR